MSAPEAILAWHEALNAGDAERVTSLSHPEVEVVGLGGSARRRQLLEDWVVREKTGAATAATGFRISGGLVAGVFRHDGLDEALRVAGLDGSDEIPTE